MTVDWPKIQEKWQKKWNEAELGKATVQKNKEKFFMIFAYPGISGFLHVGHMRGYSYTDAICRYERMQGKEVLFPVGTHATGNQAIAFANKIKNKEADWINYLKKNGCSDKTIATLDDPNKLINYFNNVYINDYWKKFGFLCDWDRFTCTTFPDYEKFIQWQFTKLQKKDLLVQKPYFATACMIHGPVAVDPSETDISQGGNAEKNEYTLLKFRFGGEKSTEVHRESDYLVAATLRPETIYGQTNLWINPIGKYVRVAVDGENWILSQECAEKIRFQKDNIILKEDIDPKTLMGRQAIAPGINKAIMILPSTFCDPKVGTGIVTSVPSDAPYDFVALKALQDDPATSDQFSIENHELKQISLIPIIQTKGFGEFPAKEIVEKYSIKSIDDPKLAEATKEIYKAGHHTGIMRENCGKYAGMRVEEAKEMVKADLLEQGLADIFHDLSEAVICRCGEKVIIKRIDDQWFIKYSDPELTERSKEQSKEMKIFPKEYQQNLPNVLDWFGDRACARLGNWLGSKFPFDKRWTVEPISDSTLYPIYYIVSKYIANESISVKDLTEPFFDYVFLGEGKGKEHWEEIREEFSYFYPLDINLGGKEHKTVHFPVFLMNHVAILPEEKWPRGIFINWWVTGKGSKISKSKGGAEPIPEAIEKYGVDAMRLYYAHIGSPHVDVVWTEEVVFNYKQSLERIHSLFQEVNNLDGSSKTLDSWLLSKAHESCRNASSAMQNYELRELASLVYFNMHDDLKWYLRRGGQNKKVINKFLKKWCLLMNPITPHLSEELNLELSLEKNLTSNSSWPNAEEDKISKKSEAAEELVKTTMEGMRNVLKLAKLQKATEFTIFIAENWMYEVFNILNHEIKVTRNIGEILKKVLEIKDMKVKGKEISKIVQSVLKDPSKLPSFVISQEDEYAILKEAKGFLEQEFNTKVSIILAEESEHPKAKSAWPGKTGLLVE